MHFPHDVKWSKQARYGKHFHKSRKPAELLCVHAILPFLEMLQQFKNVYPSLPPEHCWRLIPLSLWLRAWNEAITFYYHSCSDWDVITFQLLRLGCYNIVLQQLLRLGCYIFYSDSCSDYDAIIFNSHSCSDQDAINLCSDSCLDQDAIYSTLTVAQTRVL